MEMKDRGCQCYVRRQTRIIHIRDRNVAGFLGVVERLHVLLLFSFAADIQQRQYTTTKCVATFQATTTFVIVHVQLSNRNWLFRHLLFNGVPRTCMLRSHHSSICSTIAAKCPIPIAHLFVFSNCCCCVTRYPCIFVRLCEFRRTFWRVGLPANIRHAA